MAKNTSEKKPLEEKLSNLDRIDREIVGEILQEVPEVASIGRSDWLQAIGFPLTALIAIIAIPLLLVSISFRDTRTLATRDLRFSGVESPILRSAAEEVARTRRTLDEKDVRIRQYQDRIADLDSRLRLIQELMRDTLRRKETQLLDEIDSILGDERRRLEVLGRTDQQIETALDRLQSNLESDYTDKMDEFRNLELQVYETRLADLKREKAGLEKALATAVEERRVIAGDLEGEESVLLAQLYQEKELRNIETADIRADLEMLRESRKTENYWLDELANQYLGLLDAISMQDEEKAEVHLAALHSLFDERMIITLPGIAARNDADRELVRFFRSYVQALGEEDSQVILAETTRLVELAKSNTEAGRLQEAEMAWRRIIDLWPLMNEALTGRLETADAVVASDFQQYADASRSSLQIDDYRSATTNFNQALETIPGRLGEELVRMWGVWERAQEERLEKREQAAIDALAMEMVEAAARNKALRQEEENRRRAMTRAAEEQRRILGGRITELENELETARTALKDAESEPPAVPQPIDSATREDLAAAENRIMELQNQISELEDRLAESESAASSVSAESAAVEWRLYGVIVQIVGDTLVIEPLLDQSPSPGSRMRVMRSLGGDRVIHLADGTIIDADGTRATARLSTDADGGGTFGTPSRDDLVYLTAP